MRGWQNALRTIGLGLGIVMLGAPPGWCGPCDEYDPTGPARSSLVTLDASALTDEMRDEMRSFIATDSIGKVEVAIVSESPGDAVRVVSAVPEISRYSRYQGEELKGIAIVVSLRETHRPVRLVLSLRQVCAKYFRNTFLYY